MVALAGFHQLPADAAQISYQFAIPGQFLGNTEILRAAKALTFKAKLFIFLLTKLVGSSLPAIAKTKDGDYIILARIAEEDGAPTKGLVQDLREQTLKTLSADEFNSLWSGEVIFLNRKCNASGKTS